LVLLALVLMTVTTAQKVDVHGKTVLVTGASSGIGEAISRFFASQGMNVVLAARRVNNLERIVKEIEENEGGKAFAVEMDVTSEASQRHAFEEAERQFGAINFVVANAGAITDFKDFFTTETAIDDARRIFDVNVIGVAITIREGVKALRKFGGGAIVVVSSIAGTQHGSILADFSPISGFHFAYAPSKAAVDHMVRILAVALRKENIRIYNVAPYAYASVMFGILADSFSANQEDLGGRMNTISGKLGDPVHIGHIMLPMFDNTTAYTPGGVVLCDSDATFAGAELYRQFEDPTPTRISNDVVRDVTGHKNYFKKDDKESSKTSSNIA